MAINGLTLRQLAPIEEMLKRKVHAHGVSHGMSEAGYDIRIKQEIRFFPPQLVRINDMELETPAKIVRIEPCTQTQNGLVTERRGRFITASAMEKFCMPTSLMAIVHDKSSWARKGLSVFNTVLEPGWRGFLTLELVFHGSEELIIPAGAGIAQVVFHPVSDAMLYDGRYQDQEDRPVEAIDSSTFSLT